jgi:bifunctional NMN adenylyltransferase/nudix hydrolase
VFVTVDAVVRCVDRVLLIRRGRAPGVGLHAVPGGFIEQRETAYQSALRELAEETHLELLADTMQRTLRATAVFDHPDRSLRGRTITHAHYFDLGDRELPEVRADDDAQSVAWVPIVDIPAMEDRFHDDHFHMLDHFLGLTREGLTP